MPPVGFDPTISAGERPQTCALDRAATGIGVRHFRPVINEGSGCGKRFKTHVSKYRVIKKDGLNFVLLYFLNCTWYVNVLHNI